MNTGLLTELADHPRPDGVRRAWVDLCGRWHFGWDPSRGRHTEGWQGNPGLMPGHVQVPFPVESKVSGVGRGPEFSAMWYGRRFSVPDAWHGGGRVLLRFGAVDRTAQVWVNGTLVGGHDGGYTPFSFDVTKRLRSGHNALCLQVTDPPDPRQPRGKQALLPMSLGVFYPGTSGVWQPVWLEHAGEVYVEKFRFATDPATGQGSVRVTLAGGLGRCTVRAVWTSPDGEQREAAVTVTKTAPVVDVAVPPVVFQQVAPWSPDSPALYPVTLRVEGEGMSDEVRTYAAFRSIAARGDRIFLNGEELFQQLVLCQGYFPQGISTPMSPEAFRRDVEDVKAMGFNGLRMHAKTEDPRFLFYADALGLLVWAEMPRAYLPCDTQRSELTRQWFDVLARDVNHPSIITWVPVNESWGAPLISFDETQRRFVKDLYEQTKRWDPTRLVVDNSGFEHTTTDVLDLHHYLPLPQLAQRLYRKLRDPAALASESRSRYFKAPLDLGMMTPYATGYAYRGEPVIISEYGGYPFYRSLPGLLGGIEQAFREYTLDIAREGKLRGYCYTQLYDTFQEKNGLLTFEREPKVPMEVIAAVNAEARRVYFGG